jgi:hypothetical protein
MNVKLIRFNFGQEVVAELVNETDSEITITNSLAVVPTSQGTVAFVPFMPLVDKGKDEVVINKQHVIYITDPSEQVVTQHRNAFSAVITPEKSLIL